MDARIVTLFADVLRRRPDFADTLAQWRAAGTLTDDQAAAVLHAAGPRRPDCVHLGPARPRQACGCGLKLRRCDLHGECTSEVPRPGVRCCGACPDREDP